jgi:hypothetical protein
MLHVVFPPVMCCVARLVFKFCMLYSLLLCVVLRVLFLNASCCIPYCCVLCCVYCFQMLHVVFPLVCCVACLLFKCCMLYSLLLCVVWRALFSNSACCIPSCCVLCWVSCFQMLHWSIWKQDTRHKTQQEEYNPPPWTHMPIEGNYIY